MDNQYISNILISNSFSADANHIKERGGINKKLNKQISSLIDPTELAYIVDLDKIVNTIKDKKLLKYQQELISKRLDELSHNTLDIDKIEICIQLTPKDIDKLLSSSSGLSQVRKGRTGRIYVKEQSHVGTKNRGFSKKNAKAFYTKKYSIILDDDDYRTVEIYIGDSKHPNNLNRSNLKFNAEIHFVPTRFSLEHISMIFWQIKTKLGNRRFSQLMAKACVRRFDTGYMLYGVSQLFGFTYNTITKFTKGISYPEQPETAQETSYIGRLQNNNIIAYEKVLKEFKFFATYHGDNFSGHDFRDIAKDVPGLSDWYQSRVCTFRIEARHIADKNMYRLSELPEIENGLTNTLILKPKYLQYLTDEELNFLVCNKSIDDKESAFVAMMDKTGHSREEMFFQFDKEKLQVAHKITLTEFIHSIQNPRKTFNAPKIEFNYSLAAKKCKEYLMRIAKDRVVTNPTDIDFHDTKIVYVEGCAGAGKTTLISNQIGKLPISYRSKVAIWTFTNGSVEDISREINDNYASNIQNIEISTISAWCSKCLRSIGSIQGSVINNKESIDLIRDIIGDKEHKSKNGNTVTAEIIFSIITHARNFDKPDLNESMIKIDDSILEHGDYINSIYDKYKEKKTAMEREDFDGLIESVNKKMRSKTNLKRFMGSIKYLFVDEVQDLNSRQWAILKKIREFGIKIMVVGDPGQSMYQFRGATPQKAYSSDLMLYRLLLNYRSTPQICQVTNVYRKMISNKLKNSFSSKDDGDMPRLKIESSLDKALSWICKDIKSKKIKDSKVFVLCRFHQQLEKLECHIKKYFKKKHSIQMMTFHGSKGLQAETVYVLDPRFKWMGFTDADEELCNMYVALSRAEKNLIVVSSNSPTVSNTDRNYKKRNLLDHLERYFKVEN